VAPALDPPAAPATNGHGPLRVVIASDVRVYRDGLARILADRPDVELAGASPLAFAAERAERLRPRVLLADSAAVRDGRLVREVCEASPETLVVAFAVDEREDEVVACAEAGAAAYVPRDASVEELVQILAGAAGGELLCPPKMAASVFRRVGALAADGKARVEGPPLTAREAEIGDLLAQGMSNKQIARELSIRVSTVKNHVHNVLEKMRVSRRGEAAARVRGPSRANGNGEAHED
jgi:two-component system, NarL family, nitrate/nitrite response regulator NarL